MPISKYVVYMENSTYFVPSKWATFNQSNPFTSAYPFDQHWPQFDTVQTLGTVKSINLNNGFNFKPIKIKS